MTLEQAQQLGATARSPDPVELLDLRGDVAEAMSFAARRYAGKWRKNPREKELDHAVRVAVIVRSLLGFGEATPVIVALLHDTLEKTSVRYDQLAWCFGVEISSAVKELTKPDFCETEEKLQYEDKLAHGSRLAVIVKVADLLDNLFSRQARGDCSDILESAKSFLFKVKAAGTHRALGEVIQMLERAVSIVDTGLKPAAAA